MKLAFLISLTCLLSLQWSYIKPVYSNNSAKDVITMDMSDDPTRMKSLFDLVEEPEPEKPEKLSWKKQQRMRKNNPMWKPN